MVIRNSKITFSCPRVSRNRFSIIAFLSLSSSSSLSCLRGLPFLLLSLSLSPDSTRASTLDDSEEKRGFHTSRSSSSSRIKCTADLE